MILTPQERERAYTLGSRAMLQYDWLHRSSRASGGTFWRMRPKSHYAYELLQMLLTSSHNPRFAECWNDESEMGRFARLYRRCHQTTAMKARLERYARGLLSKWWKDFGTM